jgi:hypothetical protein
MLGRLRMRASEAIDVYLKLSQNVFQPRRNQMDLLARARDRVQLRGRFDGDALAQAVRDIVQKSGEAPESLLIEPQDGPCKVCVPAPMHVHSCCRCIYLITSSGLFVLSSKR